MAPLPILVSACLLGEAVRYDGGHCRCQDPLLARWVLEGRVVPFCPEVGAGLGVPRDPVEILGPDGGDGVLEGRARVMDAGGKDVTALFLAGGQAALAQARLRGCVAALLKEGSPSCGVGAIHDGAFSGRQIAGRGVTASVLARAGIAVFGEADLDRARTHLAEREAGG